MKTDEGGKWRLDLVNKVMAHHIVSMGAEVAEEEGNKKRHPNMSRPESRLEDVPEDTLPSFRRAIARTYAHKRIAEEEPDDPMSGVWENTDREEEHIVSDPRGEQVRARRAQE